MCLSLILHLKEENDGHDSLCLCTHPCWMTWERKKEEKKKFGNHDNTFDEDSRSNTNLADIFLVTNYLIFKK